MKIWHQRKPSWGYACSTAKKCFGSQGHGGHTLNSYCMYLHQQYPSLLPSAYDALQSLTIGSCHAWIQLWPQPDTNQWRKWRKMSAETFDSNTRYWKSSYFCTTPNTDPMHCQAKSRGILQQYTDIAVLWTGILRASTLDSLRESGVAQDRRDLCNSGWETMVPMGS